MENMEIKLSRQEGRGMEDNDTPVLVVPESEISWAFSRSGGKGGQNINKLSTKAEARWNIDQSQAFTLEEKEKIKLALGNRINKEGDLIVVAQEERSQIQNRERAIERLNNLVSAALIPEKERVATKPTRASRERRLEEKKLRSQKKSSRRHEI